MPPMGNEFVERIVEAQRDKRSIAMLGIDPQLDAPGAPGVPAGYTLARFCCEIIEACAPHVIAVKPQLAFFEARGLAGMTALAEVIATARRLGLVTIADAKRGDIGSTSAAYAQAFLGDGEFGCDAATINPYLGSDAIMPFLSRVRAGRGLFVLVKTSNPSSGEFQDLELAGGGALWERVAGRVDGWGAEFIAAGGLSPVGAVVGATYPEHARRSRALMPRAIILVPGYGTQGAGADDAVAAARADGLGIIVNASRSLMYAYARAAGLSPGAAAAKAAESMRVALNDALMRGISRT
ncbi:MAG TPA: orotidine-5'-phosphate decarboxylase [Candidatus Binataceae bacterium]|nr:orotidine-5'-phosphate decarboxylase [Candidatus Binataceae bacterium]